MAKWSAALRKSARAVHLAGLGAVATLWISAPASAELAYSTSYRDHPVSGSTPATVWHSMNAHPIIDPDDGPAYANLTHAHDVSVKTATVGGVCRVTDLKFTWHFVLTLPKAVDYGRMSSANRALWTSFRANLKRHEEMHRTIFVGCGKEFVPAAEAMTGPAGCVGVEAKVRDFIDRRYTACMAKQREFEKADRGHITASPFLRAAGAD